MKKKIKFQVSHPCLELSDFRFLTFCSFSFPCSTLREVFENDDVAIASLLDFDFDSLDFDRGSGSRSTLTLSHIRLKLNFLNRH